MSGTVVQGIDTLTSAMKGNIIPDQEYLLQGSLLDSHIEVFKHRLRGLCDNTIGGEEQFCEREMVFAIRGTSPQPLSLRVRKVKISCQTVKSKYKSVKKVQELDEMVANENVIAQMNKSGVL